MPGEKTDASSAGSGSSPGTDYERISGKSMLTTECNGLLKLEMSKEGTFLYKSREKAAQ